MMRNGMPALASASASSPPRPNTQGSPPLSRSTRLPRRASAMRRSEMLACDADGLPPRLPANSSAAPGLASASTRGSTRASWTTTSACGETGKRLERQQRGIAGAGAGEPDLAGSNTGSFASAVSIASLMVDIPRGDRLPAKFYWLCHGRATPSPPRLDDRRLRHGRGQGRLCGAAQRRRSRPGRDRPAERTARRLRPCHHEAEGWRGDRRHGQGCRRRSRRDPWRAGAGHGAEGRGGKRRAASRPGQASAPSPCPACRCRRASRRSIRCRAR